MTDKKAFLEAHWYPRAPLAADRKTGPFRRTTRAKALTHAYIEANPLVLQSLVVTDHDGGCADEIPGLLGLPTPSWTVLNPHTRSGHVVYALNAPVCLSDAANRRPINLLARIEAGFTTILGGDPAFAGKVTKNPLSDAHLPLWGEEAPVYSLKELAKALADIGALPRYDNHKALRVTGVGRNVDLFTYLRKWAYPRRGSYTELSEWDAVVYDRAMIRNQDIIATTYTRGPLSTNEVKQIAQSVSRWTWRNIAPIPVDTWLKNRQAQRGQRSAEKRWGGKLRKHVEQLVQEGNNA